MESFFVRYRNIVVLLAILVAQIVGLAMQVRRTDSGRNVLDPRDGSGVRLIRLWANALVSPPERLIHSSTAGVANLWRNYLDLRHVREQNQQLQGTIDRLRLEQAELLEDARQGKRLQALLGFQEKYIYKTLAAQAIGSSGSDQSRVFYIDKGSADGLQRDMPVITADGIVGKVRDVFPHTAQVLAINDQTSGAGVILAATRIRGILRGNASGQLEVVDITADERIKPGEKVLTAGGDMVFPRGLPVGEVEKVVPDPDQDSFIDVIVKPAAHLNRLEEVLVITSTEPRFPPQDQHDLAASEALDAAQAAAIEEQQKAAQITAERLPGLTEPNVPPDQQPLNDSTPPNPMAQPPQPLHPDRFSPAATADQEGGQPAQADRPHPAGQSPDAQAQPGRQRPPRRNP
ncbi:MAG: rod shape-determining protein MreC [Acidobacteriota bacterium]|nr:rod shape-determining protein MreC [Acidobacteriota bacterium]